MGCPVVIEQPVLADAQEQPPYRSQRLGRSVVDDPHAVGRGLEADLDLVHRFEGVAEKSVGGRRVLDLAEVIDH